MILYTKNPDPIENITTEVHKLHIIYITYVQLPNIINSVDIIRLTSCHIQRASFYKKFAIQGDRILKAIAHAVQKYIPRSHDTCMQMVILSHSIKHYTTKITYANEEAVVIIKNDSMHTYSYQISSVMLTFSAH